MRSRLFVGLVVITVLVFGAALMTCNMLKRDAGLLSDAAAVPRPDAYKYRPFPVERPPETVYDPEIAPKDMAPDGIVPTGVDINTDQPPDAGAPTRVKGPMIAIIIDDLGEDLIRAEAFIDLKVPLTFSILPFTTHQTKIATRAREVGFDVMLHLPMEPMDFPEINPGDTALYAGMDPNEFEKRLARNLDAVPGIIGVNNHMGSRLTAMQTPMETIFTQIKKRDLFFIDSLTTPKSRGEQVARHLQISFARRHIFLDHEQAPDAIAGQLEKLIKTAEKKGVAIGIAHPHDATLSVLKNVLPTLNQAVTLVPISTIMNALPS